MYHNIGNTDQYNDALGQVSSVSSYEKRFERAHHHEIEEQKFSEKVSRFAGTIKSKIFRLFQREKNIMSEATSTQKVVKEQLSLASMLEKYMAPSNVTVNHFMDVIMTSHYSPMSPRELVRSLFVLHLDKHDPKPDQRQKNYLLQSYDASSDAEVFDYLSRVEEHLPGLTALAANPKLDEENITEGTALLKKYMIGKEEIRGAKAIKNATFYINQHRSSWKKEILGERVSFFKETEAQIDDMLFTALCLAGEYNEHFDSEEEMLHVARCFFTYLESEADPSITLSSYSKNTDELLMQTEIIHDSVNILESLIQSGSTADIEKLLVEAKKQVSFLKEDTQYQIKHAKDIGVASLLTYLYTTSNKKVAQRFNSIATKREYIASYTPHFLFANQYASLSQVKIELVDMCNSLICSNNDVSQQQIVALKELLSPMLKAV